MKLIANSLRKDISVGAFLGKRMLLRAPKGTTILIVFVMMLTFVNMVAVYGILVGLIDGGNIANKNQYSGDLLISKKSGESSIIDSPSIQSTIENSPLTSQSSVRYMKGVSIEANYQFRTDFDAPADTVGSQLVGIDPIKEDLLTKLSEQVVEGEYLSEDEPGSILVGADLLRRYNSSFGEGFDSIDTLYVGDHVKVTVGDTTEEFIVKGIVDSKVGEVSLRSFVSTSDYKRLVEPYDLGAGEIAVKTVDANSAKLLKENLMALGFNSGAKIQLAEEAIPEFLNQIKIAFGLLGSIIGFVGLVVASVTIFIVIFINAVTRRRQIGVLKAIGISPRAIRYAYMLQAFAYSAVGILAGLGLIYGLLVPYFNAHPLDFPFSDGILSAPIPDTMRRSFMLLIISAIAGIIPAWLIVRKNTLDSIAGR